MIIPLNSILFLDWLNAYMNTLQVKIIQQEFKKRFCTFMVEALYPIDLNPKIFSIFQESFKIFKKPKIICAGQGCCQMISEGRGGWPSGIMPRKSRALALMRPANRQQNPTISHPPWLSHRNIEVRRWEIHSVRWDKYGWPNLGNTVWGPVNLGPAH